MKAVVIDDENPALMHMQRLIERDGRLQIVGMFNRAQDAIAQWCSCKANVVFMDIDMPDISGLEAGERLVQLDPDLQIVYVTACDHYVQEVCERKDVLDYLLKPVDPERFSMTVTNLEQRRVKSNVL